MLDNLKRDRALRMIKALLNKTEDNGASKEEAEISIQKAHDLMREYYLTLNDIEDLKEQSKIISKSVVRYKMLYDDTFFLYQLNQLFDCKGFLNKVEITFVGYDADVEICIYLYNKIITSMISEINKFKKSHEYSVMKVHYHGRTLVADFVFGFNMSISDKLENLFFERQRKEKNNETGIILSKRNNVEEFFNQFNLSKGKRPNLRSPESDFSFSAGSKAGRDLNLNEDLSSGDIVNTKNLK